MIEHVAVNVTDLEGAKQLYSEMLGLFGYRVVYEEPGVVAYFADSKGLDFGIARRDPAGGAHVAFGCADRATVDRFYEAALAAGATDNGPPGIRAKYDPSYYAAYVLDHDGNNVEAVCHKPE
jgi:catechol 2,3-dioxygenase-like lactoylglutathione lyase family enzyme